MTSGLKRPLRRYRLICEQINGHSLAHLLCNDQQPQTNQRSVLGNFVSSGRLHEIASVEVKIQPQFSDIELGTLLWF